MANRPVREWDLGKKEEPQREREHRDRERERDKVPPAKEKMDRERERERDRDKDRERSHRGKDTERRRLSSERGRRSPTLSPRKYINECSDFLLIFSFNLFLSRPCSWKISTQRK